MIKFDCNPIKVYNSHIYKILSLFKIEFLNKKPGIETILYINK